MQNTIKGYEVQDRIGKGGFGEVYRAYQPLIERDVAIKVILPVYANEPEFIRRFESEAQIVARLEHPFIVPLYDFWRDSQGAYLVMRWLPNSLKRVLEEGPLSLEDTLRMTDQIAAALAIAHRNHVIHRDIKPDNILLDNDDNAYLTDFGIAKVGTTSADESDEDSESAGSPAYMSPEQISVAMQASPASDIYSLGFVIYEMLTGKHPFTWEYLPQVLIMHLQEDIPDLPEDLHRLDHVLKRATMKDPDDRYQSVLEFAAALRGAALGEAVAASIFDESTLINPYKGLRAFEEADTDDFFGRDALIQQMIDRLEDDDPLANFLAVVGPSGSGKSSVVHAGLIPRLRMADDLYMIDMVPGSTPINNLTAALLSIAIDPPTDLAERIKTDANGLDWAIEKILNDTSYDVLLVIDQFEEVFTLVDSEAERAHFLDLLRNAVLDPTPRIKIVITLRADFYDRPLLYEGIGEFVQKRTQVVLPLSTEELTRTIVGPAERVGMVVEPELIAAVVEDVREEPGALPLLQYALTEVFERRNGKNLTLAAYRESGGVVGALARRADEVYQSLSMSDQRVVRQIMLRLVTLGEGTEDTRRRVRHAELLEIVKDKDALSRVLDAYGKYRLLTFDVEMNTREPMVEVAHEAIIREWGRLREWLSESRDDVRLQRLLANAAQEWQKSNEDKSYLLGGTRLVQFDEWMQETDLALSDLEMRYLKSSLKERERSEQVEQERQERERLLEQRSRSRLQALVALLGVAVVIAGILSAWALSQNQAAQRSESTAVFAQEAALTQASIAELNANQAQAVALAANARVALNNSDNELAIALALAANEIEPRVPEARRALADVIYQPGLHSGLGGHSGGTTSVTLVGSYMLTGGFDGDAIVWDIATLSPITRLSVPDTTVGAVALNSTIAAAGTGRTLSRDTQLEVNPIILFDPSTGEEITRLEGHSDGVTALIMQDDNRLLSASFNGEIIYWDLSTGEILWQIQEESGSIISNLSISPDGTRFLASASSRTNPTLYDLETGEAILTLDHEGVGTDDVLFLDDNRAFTASRDGIVRLWDLTDNRLIRDYLGNNSRVRTLTLDLAHNQIFSAASNSMIIAWDIDTGESVRGFFGRGPTIVDMIYLPETDQMITAGGGATFDDAMRLWDINNGAVLRSMTLTSPIQAIAQLTDNLLITGTDAGEILQINTTTLETEVLAVYENTVFPTITTANGRAYIATDSEAGFEIVIWDGEEIARLSGHTDVIEEIFVVDDAIISGSFDNTVRRWDIETGEEIARFTLPFQTLSISPDGESLLGISQDGVAVIVDARTGERLNRFQINVGDNNLLGSDWHDGLVIVSLSDGSLIAVDPSDGSEINRFGGGGLPVEIVQFYTDGSLIITAPLDATLTFWETATGSDVERRSAHAAEISALLILSDGRRMVSASRDGQIILWRIDPTLADLTTWVYENRTVRDLTCAERAQYNVLPLCEVTIPTPTAQPIQQETVQPGEYQGDFAIGSGDVWLIEAHAGDILTVNVEAANPASGVDDPQRRIELGLLDTAMILRDPDGRVIAENDDRAAGEDTNSGIEGVTLLLDGVYQIEVRSFGNQTGGAYTITIAVESGE